MRKRLIALICSLLVSQQLLAATVICSGQVTKLAQVNGAVIVYIAEAPAGLYICHLDQTVFSTTPTDCKSYLNQIYLAWALQQTVSVYVINPPQNGSCSVVITTPWFAANVSQIQTY